MRLHLSKSATVNDELKNPLQRMLPARADAANRVAAAIDAFMVPRANQVEGSETDPTRSFI